MNMNNIVLGHQGKVEMLKAVFGSADDKPGKKVTAHEIRNFAATHNAVTGRKKNGDARSNGS
jgi:hypothetical protein